MYVCKLYTYTDLSLVTEIRQVELATYESVMMTAVTGFRSAKMVMSR